MRLEWRKCARDSWCRFETAVLPDPNASGILVVWSETFEHIVYVAEGAIAMNLKWARQFEPIATRGELFVTWANVPEADQGGVRNYVSERLRPAFRDRPAPVGPIPVNLPWDSV